MPFIWGLICKLLNIRKTRDPKWTRGEKIVGIVWFVVITILIVWMAFTLSQ